MNTNSSLNIVRFPLLMMLSKVLNRFYIIFVLFKTFIVGVEIAAIGRTSRVVKCYVRSEKDPCCHRLLFMVG